MANRFWVGGTGTWDISSTTHWSATSGGASGASAPSAADDVLIDANSGGGTITISAAVCRSVDCTGAPSTTIAWNNSTLNIGDGSGGSLKLVSNIVSSGNGTLSFVSSSTNGGSGWGITCAGKTLPATTFNGAGKWVFQDAFASGGTVTLTQGTLDTNGQSVTAATFSSSNSNTRTITLGSSSITLSGVGSGTGWQCATNSNMTVTANTATVNLTGASNHFNGNKNWNGLSVVFSGSVRNQFDTLCTVANVTRTGTASKTDEFAFSTGGTTTITGTLTINGNSSTNRLLVLSLTTGSTSTVSANTVSVTNADFQDIAGAGAANWNLSSITGGSGDCGGNSGITFTSNTTLYKIGATQAWSSVNAWSTNSGGAVSGRVPLPQDNVILDGNSGDANIDMVRIGQDLSCTGYTGTLSSSNNWTMYGSLTLASGMNTSLNGQSIVLSGRATHTIAFAGKILGAGGITFAITAPSGSYTLQDALEWRGTFQVNNGSFDTNNNDFTVGLLQSNNSNTRSITLGTSIVTLTTASTATSPWAISNTTNLTFSGASSSIIMSASTANTRTFAGGGLTYGEFSYISDNSPGTLIISGSNTFSTLNVGSARSLQLTAGTTQTVTSWNVNGINRDYVYLPGVNGSTITTPDHTSLDITGDIDITVKVTMPDWTPSAASAIASKWTASGSQRSWILNVLTGGALQFQWSEDGVGTSLNATSISFLLADGTTQWVRVTADLDNEAGGKTFRFYKSDDGTTWEQVGSDNVQAGTTSIFSSSSQVELGAINTGGSSLATMKLHRAIIKDGINGTIVADFNAANKPTGADTYTDATGKVWTLNGLAKQGDGRVTLESSTPGSTATLSKSSGIVTSDYLTIRDSTATGGATWYAGNHSIDISNNSGWIFGSTNFEGWGDPL